MISLSRIDARSEARARPRSPQEDHMLQLRRDRTHEIITDPRFRNLASTPAKLRWSLSIVTLIMFFGFIALSSSAKSALGVAIAGSSIPLGLLLAIFMI